MDELNGAGKLLEGDHDNGDGHRHYQRQQPMLLASLQGRLGENGLKSNFPQRSFPNAIV